MQRDSRSKLGPDVFQYRAELLHLKPATLVNKSSLWLGKWRKYHNGEVGSDGGSKK
jgi:hypothetical protein